MRAFIAVEIDPAIKAAMADLQRRLRRLGSAAVSWTRESGLHLTLKFLGEIEESQAAGLREPLAGIAAATASFPLLVRGTGTFPPGRPPRVLWVGLEAPSDLAVLQSRIERAAEDAGIPREERPFHPHLTLGRVKANGGLHPLLAELERSGRAEFGRMTVRSVVLFQSDLKPSGAEYTRLGIFEFR
ncbi:MAG: RNA 2',3'-cyclic phosphodiesterase [Candidatus Aminicenantes bacterium]|nr:RNA 2',3'-cyclic phosphodiesterase [Candidatus Aminicenantes bacterium]